MCGYPVWIDILWEIARAVHEDWKRRILKMPQISSSEYKVWIETTPWNTKSLKGTTMDQTSQLSGKIGINDFFKSTKS